MSASRSPTSPAPPRSTTRSSTRSAGGASSTRPTPSATASTMRGCGSSPAGAGRRPGFGHVAITASGRPAVDAAYAGALAAGGTDDGAPGPRHQYGPRYYSAYLLDPDGLRVEVVDRLALTGSPVRRGQMLRGAELARVAPTPRVGHARAPARSRARLVPHDRSGTHRRRSRPRPWTLAALAASVESGARRPPLDEPREVGRARRAHGAARRGRRGAGRRAGDHGAGRAHRRALGRRPPSSSRRWASRSSGCCATTCARRCCRASPSSPRRAASRTPRAAGATPTRTLLQAQGRLSASVDPRCSPRCSSRTCPACSTASAAARAPSSTSVRAWPPSASRCAASTRPSARSASSPRRRRWRSRGATSRRGARGRVELRDRRVEELDDEAAFDVAWLPASFLVRRRLRHRAGHRAPRAAARGPAAHRRARPSGDGRRGARSRGCA